MNRFSIALVGLVLAGLVLAGCQDTGGRSPEACFETIKQAAQNNDLRAFYATLNPEKVHNKVVDKANEANDLIRDNAQSDDPQKAALARDLRAIFEKYGLPVQDEVDMKAMMDKVDDKSGLLAEIVTTIKRHQGEEIEDVKYLHKLANAQLTDVKVDGNKASAKATMGDDSEDLAFIRINGRWYLDRDPQV